MSQILLVNPAPRGKKKMPAKKRRTPAQRRNDKRLGQMAKARARANKPKRKTTTRKRVAVKAPSRATGRRPSKRLVRRRTVNTKRGYFPNPSRRRMTLKAGIENAVDNQLKPAAIQAGGALLLDVGYGYFGSYIPDALNTGVARHATKGFIAMTLGYIASNFVANKTANELAKGGLTIVIHDAAKELLAQQMPSLPLNDYYNPAPVVGMGAYVNDNSSGLGAYVNDGGTGFNQSDIYDSSVIDG